MTVKTGTKKTAKKKTVTKPKEVFLVQYDLVDSGDPVKEFTTLDAAKAWVKEIVLDEYHYDDDSNEVDITSFKIYKGILLGKPKLEVTFSI